MDKKEPFKLATSITILVIFVWLLSLSNHTKKLDDDLNMNYYTVEQSDMINRAELEAYNTLEKRLKEKINKTYERADSAFIMGRMSLWYNGEEFQNNIGSHTWQELPNFPICLFDNMTDSQRMRSIDEFTPTLLTYAVDKGNITYFVSVSKSPLRCAYRSPETNYLMTNMNCEEICTS